MSESQMSVSIIGYFAFYDVEKPGTFGTPIRIFGASKKRGFPWENRDEWDSYAFGATKEKQ